MKESSKTAALVRNISDVDYIEVSSELEAIILEAVLIRQYKPKYNIVLKDDKSSLCIVVRNEKVKKKGKLVNLPRVLTARETDLKKTDKAFGPYPHGSVAKHVIRSLRKMFPYRDCSKTKFQRYYKLNQPCFYGHLGLCSAPCTNNISVEDYRKDVKKIEKFLLGKSPRLVSSVEKQMKLLSKKQQYEAAAKQRDLLEKIQYVTKSFKGPQQYIDNPYLVEDLISESLDDLVNAISQLTKIPSRIECYDISNIFGKQATGSMVVAINGRLEKREYRRFKVKLKDSPDDYEMIREVLSRRFKREKSKSNTLKKWGRPDLVVIDGGKGQVSAATCVMEKYSLDIPVIGLAKRFETIVCADASETNLSRQSEGLKLLQRLRDEAHRFAKAYHLQLRLKNIRN